MSDPNRTHDEPVTVPIWARVHRAALLAAVLVGPDPRHQRPARCAACGVRRGLGVVGGGDGNLGRGQGQGPGGSPGAVPALRARPRLAECPPGAARRSGVADGQRRRDVRADRTRVGCAGTYYAVTDGERDGHRRVPDARDQAPCPSSSRAASCAGGNMFSNVSNHRRSSRPSRIGSRCSSSTWATSTTRTSGATMSSLFRRTYDLVLTQRRQASCTGTCPSFTCGTITTTARTTAIASRRLARPRGSHMPRSCRTIRSRRTARRSPRSSSSSSSAACSSSCPTSGPSGTRSGNPTGPEKSLLGARQRAWLDEAFTRASRDTRPLVIWVSSVPWITRSGDREDGWQPYAWERQWLADRIEALGLTHRMLMIAGDAHMVAIDDGTNSNYATTAKPGSPGFPVLQAAPLDRSPSIKGGPYTHGVSAQNGQFGWVHVEDDGDRLRVTVTGHRGSGPQLRRHAAPDDVPGRNLRGGSATAARPAHR